MTDFSWVDLPWSPNADSHWSLTGGISLLCLSAKTCNETYANGTAHALPHCKKFTEQVFLFWKSFINFQVNSSEKFLLIHTLHYMLFNVWYVCMFPSPVWNILAKFLSTSKHLSRIESIMLLFDRFLPRDLTSLAVISNRFSLLARFEARLARSH